MIKYDVSLPRLLNASGGTAQWLHPLKVSVTLNITPLSYASMELPVGEYLPARGYVEIFTSMGSAGVFRVRSPQDAYGNDQTSAELEHAIVEVGDWCVLQKYDEMMAASTAMTTIFSHYRGSKWKLGNVSALGTQQIAVNADHDRVLEAMLALLDQVPDCMLTFDFSTSPWTVAVAKRGTTVAAEGRLGRNISSAKVIYDDTELCTRAYYDVTDFSDISDIDDESKATTTWYTLDADTISKWGIVERDVNVGSGATLDEALRVAQEYIKKHKEPRISISLSAQDLSKITGEAWDTFTIGKLLRLALPEYGTTVEQVITGLDWEDVYGAPEAFTVSLAYEEDTAVNFIHDIDAKGGSGGGGGGGRKKAKEWKEYWTDFKMDDKFIEMMAVHVDTNDKILQQSGLYLDSDGVLIYSRDNENMWASHLQVQADRIGLVVEGQGTNAHIKAASIVASINDEGSTIAIDANHVNISGTDSVKVLADVMETDEDDNVIFSMSGGMMVERTEGGLTSKFGIWDQGNLTGGVMVEKINGTSGTQTRILGTRIVAGDDLDAESLPDWMDTTTGLIAQKATIGDLNAVTARVKTLETDYLKTADLSATIAGIENLSVHSIRGDGFIVTSGTINGGGDLQYKGTSLGNFIASAEVSDNTLTLKKGDGTVAATFSKATTLSADWGSGDSANKLTVTAKQTNSGKETDVASTSVSISLTASGWSNGKNTITAKHGSHEIASREVDLGDPSWADPIWNTAKTLVTRTVTIRGREFQTIIDTTEAVSAGEAAGKTAGQTEAGLMLDTSAKKVKRALSSTVKEYSISASGGMTYSADTHKYLSTHGAKVGSTLVDSYTSTSGTEAYDAGYSAGWKAACGKISRSGNVIYGPSTSDVGGNAVKKYTANYTASSHSYTASKYDASSYTKEKHSYTASSFTNGYVAFAPSGTRYTSKQSGTTIPSGTTKFNFSPGEYSASSHSYTKSSYSASSYTAESHSYTASSFSWTNH